ncbi:MAG: hypothetical protein ACJ78Q_12755, partial [Chloroflexia bacterium]
GVGAGATAQGNAERGARLLCAAGALTEATGSVLDSIDRIPYEQGMASTRAQLGDEAFERLRSEGRALPLDQAIAHALEATGDD